MPVIDLLSIDHEMAWRPWAVSYFLLIGASVGATLLAVYARVTGLRDGRGALMAGTALALAAPLPLLADLHQPARFLHFYLGVAPESVMWWGSWLLPLYVGSTIALAVAVAFRLDIRYRALDRLLHTVAALTGLGVLAYTAGEMAVVAARPLWHSLAFPVVLTLTALSGGGGMAMLFDAARRTVGRGRWMVAFGSAISLITLGLWILSDPQMAALALEHEPLGLLGGVLGLGLAVPGLLALVAGHSTKLRAITGLTAVFGALAFRWELFTGAQLISKTEGAFFGHASLTAPDTLEAAIGSAGILALSVVAVVILFTVLAPRVGRRTPA